MQQSPGGCALCNHALCTPPPPLRQHQESQNNDGQTGSCCLDKAVLGRDVRYQPSQE